MNKKIIVALLLLSITATAGFFIWKGGKSCSGPPIEQANNTLQPANANTTVDTNMVIAPSIPHQYQIVPAQKTYSNSKLGFSFQYPSNWIENGNEEMAFNLSGQVTTVMINFHDVASSTTFSVEYHLAPKGAELYRYALSQFVAKQGWYAKDAKQIEVAGNKAVEAFMRIENNGKGNALNTPLQLIAVDFLDKAQTGEIQLQFKTSVTNTTEVAKFNQLVEGFKFTE